MKKLWNFLFQRTVPNLTETDWSWSVGVDAKLAKARYKPFADRSWFPQASDYVERLEGTRYVGTVGPSTVEFSTVQDPTSFKPTLTPEEAFEKKRVESGQNYRLAERCWIATISVSVLVGSDDDTPIDRIRDNLLRSMMHVTGAQAVAIDRLDPVPESFN